MDKLWYAEEKGEGAFTYHVVTDEHDRVLGWIGDTGDYYNAVSRSRLRSLFSECRLTYLGEIV